MLDILLGTLCFYWFGKAFAFRTSLIIHVLDSARCWKHSILRAFGFGPYWNWHRTVWPDLSATHLWRESLITPLIVMFKKLVWWLELCDRVCNSAGNNRRWLHCVHKEMNMVSSNGQAGCSISVMLSWYLGVKSVPKMIPTLLRPHHQSETLI